MTRFSRLLSGLLLVLLVACSTTPITAPPPKWIESPYPVAGHKAFIGQSSVVSDPTKGKEEALEHAIQQIQHYTGVAVQVDIHQMALKTRLQNNQLHSVTSLPPVIIYEWHQKTLPSGEYRAYVNLLVRKKHLAKKLRATEQRQEAGLLQNSQQLLQRHRQQQRAIAKANWYQGESVIDKKKYLPKSMLSHPVQLEEAFSKLYMTAVADLAGLLNGIQVNHTRDFEGGVQGRLSQRGVVRPQLIEKSLIEQEQQLVIRITLRDATYRWYTPLTGAVTGIIIDATGTHFVPALNGYIFEQDGPLIWGPDQLSDTQSNKTGAWLYAPSIQHAMTLPLVGERPVILRALPQTANSTIILNPTDSKRLESHEELLKKNRIAIVY